MLFPRFEISYKSTYIAYMKFRRALDNSLVLLEGVEGTPNMRGVNLRQYFDSSEH